MGLLSVLRRVLSPARGEGVDDGRRREPAIPHDLAERLAAGIAGQMICERAAHAPNGLYEATVVAFVFNHERIEGGTLSEAQTQTVFETRELVLASPGTSPEARQAANHMQMFDFMLDTLDEPLSCDLVRGLHRALMDGLMETAGEWKLLRNGVAGVRTAEPCEVPEAMGALVGSYLRHAPTMDNIARLHARYETIHPFADGNGRTGRAVVFRECLRAGLVPPVVTDATKGRYYRALDGFRSGDASGLTRYFEDMAAGYLRLAAPLLDDEALYRAALAALGEEGPGACDPGFSGPEMAEAQAGANEALVEAVEAARRSAGQAGRQPPGTGRGRP